MPSKAKNRYRQFCLSAPDLPIYMHDYYLDAVCGAAHWEVLLVEKGGKIVAAWPLFIKKRWGFQYVVMPVLGRMMGPYILPEFRNGARENNLLDDLLKQMPQLAAFEQDFNYTATNWLPFYWAGFEQTTRYSYTLDIRELSVCWNKLAPDYRNQKIPKARSILDVQTGTDLDTFLKIHNLSYLRQGKKPPVSFELLERVDNALANRKQRALFFATERETNLVHAVAYLIWDKNSAYYLMAGDDPSLRSSGASVLLAWEAIQYAHDVLKLEVFDFAGSMIRSVERVRRQFGAQQKPYFRVRKTWSTIWGIGKKILRS